MVFTVEQVDVIVKKAVANASLLIGSIMFLGGVAIGASIILVLTTNTIATQQQLSSDAIDRATIEVAYTETIREHYLLLIKEYNEKTTTKRNPRTRNIPKR